MYVQGGWPQAACLWPTSVKDEAASRLTRLSHTPLPFICPQGCRLVQGDPASVMWGSKCASLCHNGQTSRRMQMLPSRDQATLSKLAHFQ